jgi:hypothetical protein
LWQIFYWTSSRQGCQGYFFARRPAPADEVFRSIERAQAA